MPRKVETTAITIQRYSYAETSQIAHFLTEEHGRVVVMARGAYREKNSYQGPLDLLVRGRITVSFVKGRELGVLTGRKVETAYPELRQCLQRFAAASHVLQMVVETVPVGEGDAAAFRLLDRALLACEEVERERLGLLLLSFDLHLLKMLGLAPSLGCCVRCGGQKRLIAFLAQEGGVVCRECHQGGREGMALGRDVYDLLQDLSRRRLQELPRPRERTLELAQRVVDVHLGYHLDWSTPDRMRTRRWSALELGRRRGA